MTITGTGIPANTTIASITSHGNYAECERHRDRHALADAGRHRRSGDQNRPRQADP